MKKIPEFIIIFIVAFTLATVFISCNILVRAGDNSIEDTEEKNSSISTVSALPETTTGTEEPHLVKIYIDNSAKYVMGKSIQDLVEKVFSGNKDMDYNIVFDPENADILFELFYPDITGPESSSIYYYVPVVSFYSLIENISEKDIKELWTGEKTTLEDIGGNEIDIEIVAPQSDLSILENILGEKKKSDKGVESISEIQEILKNDESKVAIIPFEMLRPDFKVLKVNGRSVLDSNIDSIQYPLALELRATFKDISGDNVIREGIMKSIKDGYFTNKKDKDMVSILMTGVTALTRQLALSMDNNGILFPAEKLSGILEDADITHISNEVSFVEDCFAARLKTMVFCSRPEYIELLKTIDADVIELTGNHLNDYGPEWLEYTIDIYDREGFEYFGGGRNIEDAEKPAFFEVNGYRFAFLGANPAGPPGDWATENSPGSAKINGFSSAANEEDMKKYEEMIGNLKEQGYNVIFTFQYLETGSYSPTPQQIIDFERMSDAGASVVSGSQAHQPQGMEIRDNSFINYGLGNLFFGQSLGLPYQQGILVKHFFYKGRLINTVLITTQIDNITWQPSPTGGMQRAELLKALFEGSIKQ